MFLKKLTYTTWGFLALAVILMLVTNNNVGKQNEYDWSQQLEREGIENTLIFAGKLEGIERELMGIVSLFKASETVTRSGFKTYVTPLLKKHSFIHSIQWIPRVRQDQRLILESLAQQDGLPNFQFTIQDKNSTIIPAPPKNEYFPIYYMEPHSRSEPVLGFDISTQQNLLSYMNQARDSGKTVATNAKPWFKNDPKMMTLIFAPLYAGEGIPITMEDRKLLFMGIALGVYRVKDMIEQIISPYLVKGIFLTIFDENKKNKIYGNLRDDHLIKYNSLLNFSGRRWLLVWQGNMDFLNGPNRLHYWLSAAVFILMVFIAGIFQIVTSRTRHVENEVNLRTKELNKLKNQLAEKNLSLQELIKMKNELLGMTSHDLRNPLTSIQGYSGFLLKKGSALSEETRTEFLKIINTASGSILDLVNGLLNLSAIESGQLRLNLKPGSLRELIEERVYLYTHLALEKQIKLKMYYQELPEILIDAPRIGQVLDNLLTNAIKFSPIGGLIELSAETGNGCVRVSVKDEGPGIKSEELEKLFKPFKKLSSKPTGGEQGTGLGLAIAKKMIELHHGVLKFKPSNSQGAIFCFELPLNPPISNS